LGAGGRRFESCHPDKKERTGYSLFFLLGLLVVIEFWF